ncbi:MAG: PhoX family phosphatase [Planctomycetota bacterium]|nr:PhoX family phosphatase [Planctomycetota bacterium]
MNSDSNASRKTPRRTFSEIVQSALGRRDFLQASLSGACGALLVGTLGDRVSATTQTSSRFGFANVPVSASNTVVVPEGYVAEVLYRWGDPINGLGPLFSADASNTAAEQQLQAGMGHDGMEYFAIPGVDPNERGLLAVNHEYTDQVLLFSDGLAPLPPAAIPLEKVRKSQYAHGVSIVEIARDANRAWRVVESDRARRITACTPMRIAGPAVSRVGTTVAGTVNNCAAGRTPWGTYLTCEENFNGVFGTTQNHFVLNDHLRRYGFSKRGYTYPMDGTDVPAFRWYECDQRFDLADPNNDADRFGYVVEVDPLDPNSIPVKRTALGRFKHENAALVLSRDGRVVVYMGDDERNEYIYKYISADRYQPDKNPGGDYGRLLDEGTLYVAKFSDDGKGEWLALRAGENGIPKTSSNSHGLGVNDQPGFSDADIAVCTREAADRAGATPMDRPEWIAVHPDTKEVFVSLTNNSTRGDAHPTDAANPREKNIFGHILRWHEEHDDPAATQFQWRVFLLAGNPSHSSVTQQGNVAGDAFGCPDGLRFDSTGVLWIQTDMSAKYMGNSDFKELGNNMMLAADPESGEVRRFLTGPRGCEITGNAMTPDRCTLFVNIQHPGEPPDDTSDPRDPHQFSDWPDGGRGGRPRSATIVVRRTDGAPIGT